MPGSNRRCEKKRDHVVAFERAVAVPSRGCHRAHLGTGRFFAYESPILGFGARWRAVTVRFCLHAVADTVPALFATAARRSAGCERALRPESQHALPCSQVHKSPRGVDTATSAAARRAAPPRAHRRTLSTAAPQTKNVALRLALAPYAALSCFPLASGAAALYHSINGDEDAARGCAFFSWTGWLSLPATIPMFLVAAPYTLLCDPYERSLPDKVAKAWGRCTTAPFFSTHVEGLEACEKQLQGKPAVFVANHQSWLDIYASFWLDWDRALKIVSKASIFRIPLCGWVMSLIGHVPFDRRKEEATSSRRAPTLWNEVRACSSSPRARGRKMVD